MFDASAVETPNIGKSKYQGAGVSEKVTITNVILSINEQYNSKTITLDTINENNQVGKSKRLSLNTVIGTNADGTPKKTSGWIISAKYLVNIIQSVSGKSTEEAKAVLKADTAEQLVQNLSKELVGKSGRGIFSKREYALGKYAIELYRMEELGGTYLKYDPMDTYLNIHLNGTPPIAVEGSKVNDLPF